MVIIDQLVESVLRQYKISNPQVTFIRHNENMTYKVIDGSTSKEFVLRIHIPKEGFSLSTVQHSYDNLCSEIEFISAIDENTDILVQRPVKNIKGDYVSKILVKDRTIYATILNWIKGKTLSKEDADFSKQAYLTGVLTAKLHNFSSSWSEGKELKRHRYDKEKMISVIKQIKKGINLNLIKDEEYELIKKGGEKIISFMEELGKVYDSFGVIHADLHKSNLIIQNEIISPIDFCLSGHGYFYMDLGGIIADFSPLSIRKEVLKGYRCIRDIPENDMKYIEGFFIMSILLFMATQLYNPDTKEWYLRRTKEICRDYILPLLNNERFYENI
ncbi:phosphotransferase [Mycoplasmatota bacterium]|nr:phosphotransferase [Mycoplasmatota bacterium]